MDMLSITITASATNTWQENESWIWLGLSDSSLTNYKYIAFFSHLLSSSSKIRELIKNW